MGEESWILKYNISKPSSFYDPIFKDTKRGFREVVVVSGSDVAIAEVLHTCSAYAKTKYISMYNNVEVIARNMGWEGNKELKDRELLSALKDLWMKYNNSPLDYIREEVESFDESNYFYNKIMFIRAYDEDEMELIESEFGAISLHVSSSRSESKPFKRNYDYKIIYDTVEELEEKTKNFVEMIKNDLILEDEISKETIDNIEKYINEDNPNNQSFTISKKLMKQIINELRGVMNDRKDNQAQ